MGALRVSVVVPVHDEAAYIGPCLDALLAQTVAPDEILVVDNNCADGTTAALAAYGDRIVLVREPRQGVHHARTAGFDAATGDVLGRIDADTRVGPGWVAALHTIFADPAVSAATGANHYYDVRASWLVGGGDRLLRWICARLPSSAGLDWLHGANMAVRASAWRAVRPALCTGRELHEDVDLGIHLYAAGERIVFAPRMRAGTSARRLRSGLAEFREYVLASERGVRRHAHLAGPFAFTRAWLTARFLLLTYHPLRLLHLWHPASGASRVARKAPMAG